MRPHGRAEISQTRPRARGVCQRCGFIYNHDTFRWQMEWGGTRILNKRILVCESCYDQPQPQLRAIILPPDPIPIEFPSIENYASDDNPLSGIGFNPADMFSVTASTYGTVIGNLVSYGGLNSAYDGNTNKPSYLSATLSVSVSSYQNTIGKNWNGGFFGAVTPSQITPAALTYSVTSFSIYAPSNQSFFDNTPTGIYLQGSNNAVVWTTLYSTTSAGIAGETINSISSNLTTGNYQYHQIAIQGDGVKQVSVAQVKFNVATTGNNEQ